MPHRKEASVTSIERKLKQ